MSRRRPGRSCGANRQGLHGGGSAIDSAVHLMCVCGDCSSTCHGHTLQGSPEHQNHIRVCTGSSKQFIPGPLPCRMAMLPADPGLRRYPCPDQRSPEGGLCHPIVDRKLKSLCPDSNGKSGGAAVPPRFQDLEDNRILLAMSGIRVI